MEPPPSCGGPGQLPSLPSLKSGPDWFKTTRNLPSFEFLGQNGLIHILEQQCKIGAVLVKTYRWVYMEPGPDFNL